MANISFLEYLNQASPNIRGIVQVITNESVFLRRLRFVQVPEFNYQYGRQQNLGGIVFRALNTFYTGTAPVTNPVVELLKIFGGSIPTDRQLSRGPKGSSIRANNLAARVRRASLTFDLKCIKGSSLATPLEFDGLNARLGGAQMIDGGGGLLTLPMLDLALDQTVGSNDQKVIICNKQIRRQIKRLVIDAAGGAAVADINAPIASYLGAAIEVVDEDGDTNPILTSNESAAGVAPTFLDPGGNANAPAGIYTSMYVINPSGTEDQQNLRGLVREVDGVMIEQIAYPEINGTVVDAVEAVMGLALHHPRCATRIYDIRAEVITDEDAGAA